MLQSLRALHTRARKAVAHELDRTVVAERIIDEMARRQGHRLGPYFEWALATDVFESRFNAACSRKPAGQTLAEFARAFVDAWPPGMAVLRVIPNERDTIANPPYSKDGLWPAYLESGE